MISIEIQAFFRLAEVNCRMVLNQKIDRTKVLEQSLHEMIHDAVEVVLDFFHC